MWQNGCAKYISSVTQTECPVIWWAYVKWIARNWPHTNALSVDVFFLNSRFSIKHCDRWTIPILRVCHPKQNRASEWAKEREWREEREQFDNTIHLSKRNPEFNSFCWHEIFLFVQCSNIHLDTSLVKCNLPSKNYIILRNISFSSSSFCSVVVFDVISAMFESSLAWPPGECSAVSFRFNDRSFALVMTNTDNKIAYEARCVRIWASITSSSNE